MNELERVPVRVAEVLAGFSKAWIGALVSRCATERIKASVERASQSASERKEAIKSGEAPEAKEEEPDEEVDAIYVMSMGKTKKVIDFDLSEYTTYPLVCARVTPTSSRVRALNRRYRTIEQFHKDLKTEIKVTKKLAPFPKKKMWGNLEQNFVQQRAAGLQKYIESVAADASARTSNSFTTFFDLVENEDAAIDRETFIEAFESTIEEFEIPSTEDPNDFEDEASALVVLMLRLGDVEFVPQLLEVMKQKAPIAQAVSIMNTSAKKAVYRSITSTTLTSWAGMRDKFQATKKALLSAMDSNQEKFDKILDVVIEKVIKKPEEEEGKGEKEEGEKEKEDGEDEDKEKEKEKEEEEEDKDKEKEEEKEEEEKEEEEKEEVHEAKLESFELGRSLITAMKDAKKCEPALIAIKGELKKQKARPQFLKDIDAAILRATDDRVKDVGKTVAGLLTGLHTLWVDLITQLVDGVKPFLDLRDELEGNKTISSAVVHQKLGTAVAKSALGFGSTLTTNKATLKKSLKTLDGDAQQDLCDLVWSGPEMVLNFLSAWRTAIYTQFAPDTSRVLFLDTGLPLFNEMFAALYDDYKSKAVDAAVGLLVENLKPEILPQIEAGLDAALALAPPQLSSILTVDALSEPIAEAVLAKGAEMSLSRIIKEGEKSIFNEGVPDTGKTESDTATVQVLKTKDSTTSFIIASPPPPASPTPAPASPTPASPASS